MQTGQEEVRSTFTPDTVNALVEQKKTLGLSMTSVMLAVRKNLDVLVPMAVVRRCINEAENVLEAPLWQNCPGVFQISF